MTEGCCRSVLPTCSHGLVTQPTCKAYPTSSQLCAGHTAVAQTIQAGPSYYLKSPESDKPEGWEPGVCVWGGVGKLWEHRSRCLTSLDSQVVRTTWRRGPSETVRREKRAEARGMLAGALQERPLSADSERPASHARETEVCPGYWGSYGRLMSRAPARSRDPGGLGGAFNPPRSPRVSPRVPVGSDCVWDRKAG